MEKKCTKCGEVKSLDEFSNNKGGKFNKSSRCKICSSKYYKDYSKKNAVKIKQKDKEYHKNNKEKRKEQSKKYREKHREKINKYMNKWYKEKRKTDFLFRLRGNISANIKESLKIKGYTKRNKTYTILKCEFDFFMNWLNGVASNGYTYGVGNLHLDHVVPSSLAETEDELILLNHYSNLQLLSADENQSKGNRYVNPTNLKRVLEHHPEPNKIKEIYSRL